ncbi:MmgE/PrpD family protein [Chloroflexota bacterium]
MNNINGDEILEAIATSTLNTSYEDLDPDTIDNTKKRILDMIGNAIGGANMTDMVEMIKMVEGWGGIQESSILGTNVKGNAHDVAFVNCTMCRTFDWGTLVVIVDGRRYPSHTSETTALTALALAESKGVSGKELITACVIGDDLSARFNAVNMHPWNANMENRLGGATAATPAPMAPTTTMGATAIAGRLLGLNPTQMKNAFGLVGRSDGFGGGIWDGAPTFKIEQGTAARKGIVSAELAKAGWTGAIDPLFNERGGYFSRQCEHPEILTMDLGKKFYYEVIFKPYPGGRPTHIPIDAALALAIKNDVNTDDIDEVILHLSVPAKYGHYMRPYKVGDYPTGDALFSYVFSTASALYRRSATGREYTEESIRDPKLQELIKKVQLGDSNQPEGVELEVKMKDGTVYTEYVPVATGELPNPLSMDILKKKFMNQVEFSQVISTEDAEKLIEMLDKLEEVEDVQDVIGFAVKK